MKWQNNVFSIFFFFLSQSSVQESYLKIDLRFTPDQIKTMKTGPENHVFLKNMYFTKILEGC